MGYAYTPGLTIAADAVIRKVRRLPIRGDLLVRVGQRVAAQDVVAEAALPGEARPISLAEELGVSAEDVGSLMLCHEGDAVREGEPLARTRGFFGRFRREVRSPLTGTVESVSRVTGQVILRGPSSRLQRLAYVPGTVVGVQPGESVTVQSRGTLVQGIFGIGGEAHGTLVTVCGDGADVLDAGPLTSAHAGKIVVGGSLVTQAAIRAATRLGVRGIVTGGLDDADLRDVLGYEIGVAITGDEAIGVTVVVTEGFGRIPMASGTFDLLSRCAGRPASINGTTQIRAGVIRPEVIVPFEGQAAATITPPERHGTLDVGTRLRAIREPYFGRLGRCIGLPVTPAALATEARVRVLEIEFDDGARATLPRANVELIHE